MTRNQVLSQQEILSKTAQKQGMAAAPESSAWVAASAGTGKTKVLTDRVLRLLLPRSDGRPATLPSRILCLTFTKAAANEMALRINKTLSRWAVADDLDLQKNLTSLFGRAPTSEQVSAAQRLFANVIDSPGGLPIMTIHSFCQSVLGRFPIEAGLSPNFGTLDESMGQELMAEAIAFVIDTAQRADQAGSQIANAVDHLLSDIDEQSFISAVRSVVSERTQFEMLMGQYHTIEGVYAAVCAHYDVAQNMSEDALISAFCEKGRGREDDLRSVAMAMLSPDCKAKTAKPLAQSMIAWLDAPHDQRISMFDRYCAAFLSGDNENIRKQGFPPANVKKQDPNAEDILKAEGAELLRLLDIVKAIKSAEKTRDILYIAQAVIEKYKALKEAKGLLDYDDQIICTMRLLSGESKAFAGMKGINAQALINQWIMYKLDQGIDHVLVDEAQDTNPEQWRIIESLTSEFFVGDGARDDVLRTSFVVGDIKQSIYSFQRAAPKEFARMQNIFDERISVGGYVNHNISLDTSFRTTQSVLGVVDKVFASEPMHHSLGVHHVDHQPYRAGQEGMVALWPEYKSAEQEQRDFWDPPISRNSTESGSTQMARRVADEIRNWLDRKEVLSSRNRAIQPGDIMILLRSRSALQQQLIRELKLRNIPVSGADRMILSEQIAVQDLYALARFCLLPADDLTLAEILKCPLLGWSEEELFTLAYNRKGSLWQEVCNPDPLKLNGITDHIDDLVFASDDKRARTRDYLSRLIGRVSYLGTYEFFAHVLNMPCPADDQSGMHAMLRRLGEDAIDPLEEMLSAAMNFGKLHIDQMQLFLKEQEKAETEIKREMEEASGQVRIMTVHGSKGLQAPVVIMPDTMKSSGGAKISRFLWPDKSDLDIPLYTTRKTFEPAPYVRARENVKTKDEDEYYRLLYVAMTRAEDRLYIGGFRGKRSAPESSWYYQIRNAMQDMDDVQELDDGTLLLHNPQTAAPDKAKDERADVVGADDIPVWATTNAPDVPYPPRPLIPSRPLPEDDAPAMSPLYAADQKRFRRGNVTHKLLQFLPDIEEGKRQNAALRFVHKNAVDLTQGVREGIVKEVMGILGNPKYAPYFATDSLAEVPVTALIGDRIISGQIDRLVVGDKALWVIDYKTNRPPPTDPNNVPPIYRKQLSAYRDSLSLIYPGYQIHCALLWTDGPNLMVMDDYL